MGILSLTTRSAAIPAQQSAKNMRIVLFERIHQKALTSFRNAGFENIESYDYTPTAEELKKIIANAHVIGIRSRTKLTAEAIEAAQNLQCVGCFCIGTNQVDLAAAKRRGVPVFNAPYSNTRSVAELVIGEIILLMREIPQKNASLHAGGWEKTVGRAQEVRGKVLGVVGYGHIGSQVSILAEAVGMKVRYFDVAEKLAMGNAQPAATMSLLLAISDVVSLHVPSTPQTKGMIGQREIALMKPGSILINAARGDVVDVDAVAAAIRNGHLAGAAFDVFPVEPAGAEETLETPLRGLSNVILTPHIGGSTLEAQANIGSEVAEKLSRYLDNGSTDGAVNFVELCLPDNREATRFAHIHNNVPGMLSRINGIFSDRGLNITAQFLRTDNEIGYVVSDVVATHQDPHEIAAALRELPGTISSRTLGH
jgi:D-3-phosphoglycerate dehydrogenase